MFQLECSKDWKSNTEWKHCERTAIGGSVQWNLLFMRLPSIGAPKSKIKTKHNKETLSFEAFSFTLFGLQSILSACGAT